MAVSRGSGKWIAVMQQPVYIRMPPMVTRNRRRSIITSAVWQREEAVSARPGNSILLWVGQLHGQALIRSSDEVNSLGGRQEAKRNRRLCVHNHMMPKIKQIFNIQVNQLNEFFFFLSLSLQPTSARHRGLFSWSIETSGKYKNTNLHKTTPGQDIHQKYYKHYLNGALCAQLMTRTH